ncbi:WD repeat-containing protein 72 [Frankliniella fusca]|uniref:WD repeat-containing protein 72 n=1 Tax=Frankliniella fusca TaxID=407009 RepID=A0AAE1I5D8_9NEOP|nr:WD repeat-containing protein 72 [Frankliniella fusca]
MQPVQMQTGMKVKLLSAKSLRALSVKSQWSLCGFFLDMIELEADIELTTFLQLTHATLSKYS